MTERGKRLVQQQFGDHARQFVTSPVHARGESLERLVGLANPQPSWRVLDVATGGGHTALAFSHHARAVIAADLTRPMLAAAREFLGAQGGGNITYVQLDSEQLAFVTGSLDCVTCRIAAHHFPSVESFLAECRRVLAPGGILALADNIVSGEVRVARYVNAFERLRDPSHHWAYSSEDWQAMLYAAGFESLHFEVLEKGIDFGDWADRMGVAGDDLIRLRSMLIQAPARARAWLNSREEAGRLTFTLGEMVSVSRKL